MKFDNPEVNQHKNNFFYQKLNNYLFLHLNLRPVLTACLTHSSLITGSIPGKAESIKLT